MLWHVCAVPGFVLFMLLLSASTEPLAFTHASRSETACLSAALRCFWHGLLLTGCFRRLESSRHVPFVASVSTLVSAQDHNQARLLLHRNVPKMDIIGSTTAYVEMTTHKKGAAQARDAWHSVLLNEPCLLHLPCRLYAPCSQ